MDDAGAVRSGEVGWIVETACCGGNWLDEGEFWVARCPIRGVGDEERVESLSLCCVVGGVNGRCCCLVN